MVTHTYVYLGKLHTPTKMWRSANPEASPGNLFLHCSHKIKYSCSLEDYDGCCQTNGSTWVVQNYQPAVYSRRMQGIVHGGKNEQAACAVLAIKDE